MSGIQATDTVFGQFCTNCGHIWRAHPENTGESACVGCLDEDQTAEPCRRMVSAPLSSG